MSESVEVLPDLAGLSRRGAAEFARLAEGAARAQRTLRVALSGGETPKLMYSLLAEEKSLRPLWKSVHFYWTDERHVPPDSPDSNYRMAAETLLNKAKVPAANVHRVPTELADAAEAAARYEKTLRADFPPAPGGLPRFDLIILGLGTDGHTASLFPGSPALGETRLWAAANWVEALRSRRVTLTFPVLNAAAEVIFLVSGRKKAEAVRAAVDGRGAKPVPAGRVKPANGKLLWLLDREAASLLPARP